MHRGSLVTDRNQLAGTSRYELLVKIATGGTATVYVGRFSSAEGFRRLVAVKRAHPHLRDDPTARRMLVREATLASGIHHANVVPILDIEDSDDDLLLVMSYVEGGSLADLLDASLDGGTALSGPVALRAVLDACAGLSAVHGLTDDHGKPLGFVHRDVSPQNILVGLDGTSRLTDFGLAKLTEVSMSRTASLKGKIAYMAPEYVQGAPYGPACDIFSMGVVLWESLTNQRLFRGTNEADTIRRITTEAAPPLSSRRAELRPLDDVAARALAKSPQDRYPSVLALAEALSAAAAPASLIASRGRVAATVEQLLGDLLAERRAVIRSLTLDPNDPDGSVTASALHELAELDEAETLPLDRPSAVPRFPRSSTFQDTQTAPAAPQALSSSRPRATLPSEPPVAAPRASAPSAPPPAV
ncbi:MAG: serine/threonine protein kinase, partial [Deltaproteobacteria bacterium]|nr:serine/threonine protein kinase [Deltaproteobacteria bacterium]MBW2535775.1 serine/threonine protein kinase [Deltaproteobacteria bacterium]